MKRAYIAATAIAIMLGIAGCSSKSTPTETETQTEAATETEAQTESETEVQTETEAQTQAESEDQTSAPETQAAAEDDAAASDDSLDYISVEVSDGQAAQDALGLGADEYPTLFVLTTQEEIYDVTLWRLDMYTDDDGQLHGSEIEFLGSRETLSPGESQEMSIDPGETIPLAGFSFVDQENVVHHYYLSVSGEDGSAVTDSYIWE